LRWRIVPYLARVRDELGVPLIDVSHDLDVVRALADQVLTLEAGRATFVGPPDRAEQR
jgi:ABC-type molybdate transport system ATPase subunit